MSTMSPDRIAKLIDSTKKQWKIAIDKWEQMDEVTLYEEVQEIMCRTACEWTGVPIKEEKVNELTKDLAAMFESPASIGPSHWIGRHARNRVEKWIEELVEEIRNGDINIPTNTILYKFAQYRDVEGDLLDTNTVAVEVLNILRPIVAIAIFINFIALALYTYPEEKLNLESKDEKYALMFVQEVRRFYPFFPFTAALVKKDFTWNNYKFEKDTLTFLDLYGTNHDPKIWENPDMFDPNRFSKWEGSPFSFIPQGGGDYFLGHRCAGEWATIEIMKVSLDYLANRISYELPEQDLSFSMADIPSIPHSKIAIKRVKKKV